jgi:serine/threonine protein kinase
MPGSSPKLVTELMRGGSLRTGLESQLGWLKGAALAKIVVGMQLLHSQGYIHHDLKLGNILLDEEHLARIGGFGAMGQTELEPTLTQEVGAPVYMAPEMSEDEYTNKVDVFSFAMILYEMLVGKKAFADSLAPGQVMMGIPQGKHGEIPDKVLPFTKSLIERCWAKKVDDRSSFQEILVELKQDRYEISARSIEMRSRSSSDRLWTANVNKSSSADSSRVGGQHFRCFRRSRASVLKLQSNNRRKEGEKTQRRRFLQSPHCLGSFEACVRLQQGYS